MNVITPPTITELTARRMQSVQDLPDQTEVELHDGAAGFNVDARTAWQDATYVLLPTKIPMPAEWSGFVKIGKAFAIPMAPGTYPQQIQDIKLMLHASSMKELRTQVTSAEAEKPATKSLIAWVQGKHDNGTRKLARMLACQLGLKLPTSDTGIHNESACEHWFSGDYQAALETWEKLPESVEKAFNLGMANLFNDRPAQAIPHLEKALAKLPETTGWSHLAGIYLGLAKYKA